MDIANLKSGDRYDEIIFDRILQSDKLYLFWSRNAMRSKYVEREWRYGFNAKGIRFIDPVPLADPRRAPPPPELAEQLHFNDWILFYERYERTLRWRERIINLLLRP
jgi:hypothetical protein